MKKTIYKITVLNWSKYNGGIKKGHKATLISNNFCTDSKLSLLPLSHRWLFLGLLLACGDHTSDTIELSESNVRELLESSKSTSSVLDSLQSLQLLRYEKIEPLLIEENRRESKGKESKRREVENHSGSLAGNVETSTSPPIKKSKKVQVFTSAKEVIEAIPKATKEVWKELYSDPEYLQREALRAWHYYAIQNPKKLPKSLGGWSRVLSYWFDKNWVKHIKGVPTRRMTNSETNQQSLQDLYDKVQREGS